MFSNLILGILLFQSAAYAGDVDKIRAAYLKLAKPLKEKVVMYRWQSRTSAENLVGAGQCIGFLNRSPQSTLSGGGGTNAVAGIGVNSVYCAVNREESCLGGKLED